MVLVVILYDRREFDINSFFSDKINDYNHYYNDYVEHCDHLIQFVQSYTGRTSVNEARKNFGRTGSKSVVSASDINSLAYC